jgi:hypothetical protein
MTLPEPLQPIHLTPGQHYLLVYDIRFVTSFSAAYIVDEMKKRGISLVAMPTHGVEHVKVLGVELATAATVEISHG